MKPRLFAGGILVNIGSVCRVKGWRGMLMFPKHQPSALCWTPLKLRGCDSFPHRATDTTAQGVLEGVFWLSLEGERHL